MKWYLTALKKYACFSGRARRKEYWMFAAFNMFFSMVIIVLFCVVAIIVQSREVDIISLAPFGILAYSLAVVIPSLGVTIRRLHDTGRSGWMILVALIPFIGSIWLLVLLLKDSLPEGNRYGEDPKAAERAYGKSSIKSAAAFLAVASLFWMSSNLSSIMMQTTFFHNTLDFIKYLLFIMIVPTALLFLAAALLDMPGKQR